MPLTCPKCSRISPDDALYCHQDGNALRAFQAPAANRLARPFVFPSGRNCSTFDELVAACQDHWDEARDFLRSGVLGSYFAGMGRHDLAQAAQESARHPDPDRGLDELLSRLPADSAVGARMEANPPLIELGTLKPGEDRHFEVRIRNTGRGLLHGSVACNDCHWMQLGKTPGQKEKLFQTRDEIVIPVHVRGKVLRASNRPLEAQLVIQSNGGRTAITVRGVVPVTPFPGGPLAGATSPRQAAEKAKAHSKEAIPYFENGAVAAWYRSNGWTFPVQGPTATGLGAVQQFFEALGLTPPPKVDISQRAVALNGRAGEQIQYSLQVTTAEKRPVYAHAVCDQPWVVVGKVRMAGRTADIPLTVTVPDRPGDNLSATLSITSNGNQRFRVPVRLTVTSGSPRGPAAIPTLPLADEEPAPVPTARHVLAETLLTSPPAARPLPYSIPPTASPVATLAEPLPAALPLTLAEADPDGSPPERDRLPTWLPCVPVAFMALALVVTGARDFFFKPEPVKPPDDGILAWEEEPAKPPKELLAVQFHDEPQLMVLGQSGQKDPGKAEGVQVKYMPSMSFGLYTVAGKEGRKKLTFSERGLTQNTCVKIDGAELLFGHEPLMEVKTGKPVSEEFGIFNRSFGRWIERDGDLGKTQSGRVRQGKKSVWEFNRGLIEVTQQVEIIVGQSGDLDTCLVKYRIENKDTSEHSVGLRFLLDTYIGNNDEPPFLIPGQQELINTSFEFKRRADIPDFLQARETEDLEKPGAVAQIGLKPEGLEPPDRVTLGAYPNPRLRDTLKRQGFDQEKTLWDVPVVSMQTLTPGDSCVVIYWDEKPLPAGKSREVGFTYGMGYLAGGQSGGKLALTAGGSFLPRGELTVTAYVGNPQQGQTITLNLPDGFEFVEDEAKKAVPPSGAASRISPVTWKVKAASRTGEFTFEAETSNGLKQKHDIRIRPRGIFGK